RARPGPAGEPGAPLPAVRRRRGPQPEAGDRPLPRRGGGATPRQSRLRGGRRGPAPPLRLALAPEWHGPPGGRPLRRRPDGGGAGRPAAPVRAAGTDAVAGVRQPPRLGGVTPTGSGGTAPSARAAPRGRRGTRGRPAGSPGPGRRRTAGSSASRRRP